MKSSWLWSISSSFNYLKSSLFNIKLMNITESMLICINSSEYINITPTDHAWMSVSWLWGRAISSMNFIPIIWQKTILEYIIHSIVPIPTSKNEHRILINNSWMSKPLQRLNAFTLNFFPLIFSIFYAAFMQISVSSFPIIPSIDK